MQGKIVLIIGGTRSGKSAFAEQYATKQSDKVAYIATAHVYDQEMQTRVTLHRERRPDTWQTFEAPYHADQILLEAAKQADVILFDCLTLYTSNLLLSADIASNREERLQFIIGEIDKLLLFSQKSQATILFVTNEVGMGIVPENALAREYRDIAGMVNEKIAACADEVYLVICGLPVELKKLTAQISKEVHHG
ncbi:MAG: Adenosylcobinamide-phosphate guanylyltransferase [Pelosinus sp.]|jgi:adenosylcobinamide kinase/adenosylcobinamide-phosphate guanylyltransferase|nr:Adenosylcobinamide-phosphate guanylyltransferase [Pelosinus sp.]